MTVHVDVGLDTESLTPKQATVYRALLKGKTVQQIARQMKITPAGVYGHIRALKAAEAGTNGNSDANDGSKASAASNGSSAPVLAPGAYEAAVETVTRSLQAEQESLSQSEARISEAQRLIEETASAIENEKNEIDRRAVRVKALADAQESLEMAVA